MIDNKILKTDIIKLIIVKKMNKTIFYTILNKKIDCVCF